MNQPTQTNAWKSLQDHARSRNSVDTSGKRPATASACNITLDFSHQHISEETLALLCALTEELQVHAKIEALIRGDKVNLSESRPALHTALRAPEDAAIWVDNHNVMTEIIATRRQMERIVDDIRNKVWLGFSGKPITDIVNIGIGGSDLGPRFCVDALADYITTDLSYHFISDSDPDSFIHVVKNLTPETTLFLVSSKSFTTQETLHNAQKAMSWIGSRHQQHFIAITANISKAQQFGITNILPIWEWVGGRYSFCSAINLIAAIALGNEQFKQILAGAHSMDRHFHERKFAENLPVLLALIGIWNNNFLNIHNLLLLVYTKHLEKFVPYIQQLDMESNGKSIDNQGNPVTHATGPIIWGGLGNQAQHSYYQLLCQGTHKVSVDFITINTHRGKMINDMCTAKINVLSEGVHDQKNPSSLISGDIPLNHLQIQTISPFTIGALVALYEHKIFVQSVIWDINPFDQPGVESAKRNRLAFQ